jgi:hypothetical protein
VFRVTLEWVEQYAPAFAPTRDQFACLGIETPSKGWKQRVVGMEISEENRLRFERKLNWKQAQRHNAGLSTLELFDGHGPRPTK